MRLVLLVAAAGFASLAFTLPGPVLWAQDAEKPAIAPAPRTINLTQEQRFIIRENVKDLKLTKAQASATERSVIECQTISSYTRCLRKSRTKCRKQSRIRS